MISAKSIEFDALPVEFFPDWDKVSALDWPAMEAGFQPVGVEDCGEGLFSENLKDEIELKPLVITSWLSPLGNRSAKLRQDRVDRLSKRAGVQGETDLFAALTSQFPSVKVKVPKFDFKRTRKPDHRTIPGYRRADRYILLLPKRHNPYDDWLLLCLPANVFWKRYYIGTCGQRVPTVGFMSPETYRVQPGPFSPFNEPHAYSVPITSKAFSGSFGGEDVSLHKTHKLWGKLEAQMRKKKARVYGKKTISGVFSNLLLEDDLGTAGLRAREKAEKRIMARKFGR